jgi:hypothetical protein
VHDDRLTGRDHDEVARLQVQTAADLSFNDLLALAGQRLAEKEALLALAREAADRSRSQGRVVFDEGRPSGVDFASVDADLRDAGRDLALAFTALEDAATRYNSACYRFAGTWKRADPDRAES